MTLFQIGDLFTIKSHPYQLGITNVLIGANATFIPPILVAIEVRNCNIQDESKDEIIGSIQVKGIFYSHKRHKYEQHWFMTDEIKLIKPHKELMDNSFDTKGKTLQLLKAESQFMQVILKSVDLELEKKKIGIESRNLESTIIKQSSHLDFAPPPMHILDLRYRKMKNNYLNSSNNKEHLDAPIIEMKCKWYNPNISSYSEEWIPVDALKVISSKCDLKIAESLGRYFLYPFGKYQSIKFFTQISSIIKIKQILFNHYQFQVVAEDMISKKLFNIKMDEFAFLINEVKMDSIFEEALPNHKTHNYVIKGEHFSKNNMYEIVYLSDRNQITKRHIYVNAKHTFKNEFEKDDTLLIAYCLLRNGDVRHFKVSNIKSSKRLRDEYVNKLIRVFTIKDR